MRRAYKGHISPKQTVSASSNANYIWKNENDGRVRIKQIMIAYDATGQSNGNLTLTVAGHIVANAVDSLAISNGYQLDNLDIDIEKNEKIEVYFQNTHASSSMTFQLLVDAYVEV